MGYNPNDFYAKKAQKENFFARSVYKLQEIDEKYCIFKGVKQVMDLGASPGSWSQWAAQKVGNQGKVFAIDIQPLKASIPRVTFVLADILQVDLKTLVLEHGFEPQFDLVLSDMAPKTTGMRVTDQARSLELCQMALLAATQLLKSNAAFVCKMFESEDAIPFKQQLAQHFKKVNILRPKSTRKESKEIFFIAQQFNYSK